MTGIRRGEMPLSQRSYERIFGKSQPKRRPKSIEGCPQMSQAAWRQSLGRSGRAVFSAIGMARQEMRAIGLPRSLKARKKVGTMPKVGDAVQWVVVGTRLKCRGVVWKLSPANQDQFYTACWVLIERPRSQRERDRRLGRFIALAVERVAICVD